MAGKKKLQEKNQEQPLEMTVREGHVGKNVEFTPNT